MMKKVLITTAALSLALAVPALAANSDQSQTFNQQKSQLLKNMDQRIDSMKTARQCIDQADNAADIQACKQKHREYMMNHKGLMREDMKKRGAEDPQGRMHRPGGPREGMYSGGVGSRPASQGSSATGTQGTTGGTGGPGR
ncbi:MAG: hypothetical protein WC539_01945 [Nitrospirota bacterium]